MTTKMDKLQAAIHEMANAVELIQSGYYGKVPPPLAILLTTKSNDLTDALEEFGEEWRKRGYNPSLDEALNSGDGVYRP